MDRWALGAVAVVSLAVAAVAASGSSGWTSSTELAVVAAAVVVAPLAGGGAVHRLRSRRRAGEAGRHTGDPAAAAPRAGTPPDALVADPTDPPPAADAGEPDGTEPAAEVGEREAEAAVPAGDDDGSAELAPSTGAGAAADATPYDWAQKVSLVSPWDPPGVVDLTDASPEEIRRGVAAGERALIDQLVEDGRLSGGGPLSDTDVQTLVFVAVSSGELLGALLEADRGRPDDGQSPPSGTGAPAR